MRVRMLLFFLLPGVFACAQTLLQQKTDSVAKLVQLHYNKKDAATLYGLTSDKFKQALDEKKFTEVTAGLFEELGRLSLYQPESFENNIGKYKAVFSNATMALLIGLDNKDKLETFFITQWEPDTVKKKKAFVATSNPMISPLDKKVDALVRPYINKENTVGLVIGVLHEGKTHVYGYGETKKGSNKLPDGNTLFEIGSITKTFTATLLADLVVKGKINLSDPVNKYLPDSISDLQYNGKPVTIQSLSNHSSGLPRLPGNLFEQADANNPYKHYDDAKLFSFLKTLSQTANQVSSMNIQILL